MSFDTFIPGLQHLNTLKPREQADLLRRHSVAMHGKVANLEEVVARQRDTINNLTQLLEEAEVAIVRAAASSIGESCTGCPAPIQKSTERQPKESLPTQERLVRESHSHTRETPGNAPLLDAADNPASRSMAESP